MSNTPPPAVVAPKKLIEVALPLDEINKASAREKSIRHGHPSTLHLWWARRPLAAARAVLFAQLVNDPSWKYSEAELKKAAIKGSVTRKRNELFKLITELVQWENTNNEAVLSRARAEIRASWRETCEANKDHPEAKTLFDPEKLPAFHDPFAGGGSIPLEAQRLGLEAHATDLNPVAVLINKAMIEIPPKFAGRAPVGPVPAGEKQLKTKGTEDWSGAKGLAEDVRRYGAWMREEAEKKIGHLYPKVKITGEMVKERADLKKYEGQELTVIAYLWARTVASPNPAVAGAEVPLVSSFVLSPKNGANIWVELEKGRKNDFRFVVKSGTLTAARLEVASRGTRAGKAQDFICALTGEPVTRSYVRDEGKARRLGQRLMAVVAEGDRERVYLSADDVRIPELGESERLRVGRAREGFLAGSLPSRAMITGGVCSAYGLDTWGLLYTDRQIHSILTFVELTDAVRTKASAATAAAGWPQGLSLENGGDGALAYGESLAVYLAFVISKLADRNNTICAWDCGPAGTRTSTGGSARTASIRNAFSRQALPMTWDFAEACPLSESGGGMDSALKWVVPAIQALAAQRQGRATLADARQVQLESAVVSTDPPYYDNIGYAELSDFFYVWLRRALQHRIGELFGTILTPKAEELIVAPHRHESKARAHEFFLDGMTDVLGRMATQGHPAIPVSVYYAFKQAETQGQETASTGWEVFLNAAIRAGFAITGTWPLRTELSNRLVGSGTNALASSIVLVFRPRLGGTASIARRDFLRELDRAMPPALADMTADPIAAIAPVDLAQAAIGPGMAIFSKYSAVLEADGSSMTVHSALIHINKAIDDYFAHAEGDMDADTRFCIGWFQQYGFETGAFGEADVLARAKGTSVDGVRDAGVLASAKGKVRLLRVKDYPKDWDPETDDRTPVWEACHQLCRALDDGEAVAGALLARMPDKQDAIRQLAYRLYTVCERKKWAEEARAYNDLVTSWPEIVEASQKAPAQEKQLTLI